MDKKVLEILGTHPAYVTGEQLSGLTGEQLSWLTGAQLSWLSKWTNSYIQAAHNNEEVPVLDKPYTKILAAITSQGCALKMSTWHSCKTTHCIGGWTVHLAGKDGYEAEKKYGGTPQAASLILLKSRPAAPLPNFYASDAAAMAFIEARAAEEADHDS